MDKVVEYDIGWYPELAVSGPLLMADDGKLVFSFNATRLASDGYHRADAGRVVVRVPWCLAFKFGYPNDEALTGHPLYDHGFVGTAVYEVLESSWIAQVGCQNRVPFPEMDTAVWDVRHFLFSFHDSTLEVLCRGLEVSLATESLAAEIREMQSWLLGEADPNSAPDPIRV